jgi:hypothetical protein
MVSENIVVNKCLKKLLSILGAYWATEAIRLEIFYNHTENISNLIYITDYNSHVPSFTLSLKDYYGQKVVTEVLGSVQLFVPTDLPNNCQSFSGFIGGGIVQQFENGATNFASVEAYCAPGGTLFLNSSSDLISNNAVIELNFRSCVVGGKAISSKLSQYIISMPR